MVRAGSMKNLPGLVRRRRARTLPQERVAALAAFERSGLSAAAFARQQGLCYTTFCNWRQRQAAKPGPAFVEVEVVERAKPVEVVIQIGAQARLRLVSPGQAELAAQLLHRLNTLGSC